MVDRCRNDMLPPRFLPVFPEAKQCQIVAFGRTACKNDFFPLAFHHRRDLITRFLHGLLGPRPELVRPTAGIAEFFMDVVQEYLLHFGINRRGCVAVEIDRHGCMLKAKNVC